VRSWIRMGRRSHDVTLRFPFIFEAIAFQK
jgi:hypothetical protein